MRIQSLSRRALAAALSLLALTGLPLVGAAESGGAAPATQLPSRARAVDYLLASQQSSGFLYYGFDFLQDAPLERVDVAPVQLTRQAGTAAQLADEYLLSRDPRVAKATARLLEQLGEQSLPIGRSRLQSFVAWTRIQSVPVARWRIESTLKRYGLLYQTGGPGRLVSPDANYANAYAGATALALLAEVRYTQSTGDPRFAALRRGWLGGLIALRIPGDGFRPIPDMIDTDPYFDAEPWLALAEYHRAFPQDRLVADFLTDVDVALMRKYGSRFSFQFYHWGTMAAAVRYGDTHDPRFLEFIRSQLAELLKRPPRQPVSDNNCDLVEGVADAMGALGTAGERDGALYQRALDWTRVEMHKAARMQIEPGQTELVFANARIIAPKMQEFAGAFRNGLYTAATQVDSTGHCLSAMVKLQRHGIELGP